MAALQMVKTSGARRAAASRSERAPMVLAVSSGNSDTTPWRTHCRTASEWYPDSTPVISLNRSEPNASPFGRTMTPSWSIHTTVDTLKMACNSVNRCWQSISTDMVIPWVKARTSTGSLSMATATTEKPSPAGSSWRSCHPGRS
jgi:hypothetical protein